MYAIRSYYDVKTGAIKAMATYPSYDMNDYFKNYAEVSQRAYNPLVNRAINGLYRPGSTSYNFV